MKKTFFLLTVSLLFCAVFWGFAQEHKIIKKVLSESGEQVKVIQNPRDPLYGEFTFEVEEVLSFGNPDDENYYFYKGVRIVADNEQNIYVIDYANPRIQKFDKKGRYLMTIGRKGQGPGEFVGPGYFYLDKKRPAMCSRPVQNPCLQHQWRSSQDYKR